MRGFLTVIVALSIVGSIPSCSDDECPITFPDTPDLFTELTSGWWMQQTSSNKTYLLYSADTDTLYAILDDYPSYCNTFPWEFVEPDTACFWVDSVRYCFPASLGYSVTGELFLMVCGGPSVCDVYVRADLPDSLQCGP
jgi:hypothetical protein